MKKYRVVTTLFLYASLGSSITAIASQTVSPLPAFGPANRSISVNSLCAADAIENTCYVYINCSIKPIQIGSQNWGTTTRVMNPYTYLVDAGLPFRGQIAIMSAKKQVRLGSGYATDSLITNQATQISLDHLGRQASVASYSDTVGCL